MARFTGKGLRWVARFGGVPWLIFVVGVLVVGFVVTGLLPLLLGAVTALIGFGLVNLNLVRHRRGRCGRLPLANPTEGGAGGFLAGGEC